MRAIFSLVALSLLACGSSAHEPAHAPAPPVAVAKPAPVAAPGSTTTLRRAEVVNVVNAGFGSFLERVQVEPALDGGRFRGWTIVDLAPPEFWRAVDLKPGDVVTSVNRMPIERDMEAWAAFESLKTAQELEVAYFRAGTERKLAYHIVD